MLVLRLSLPLSTKQNRIQISNCRIYIWSIPPCVSTFDWSCFVPFQIFQNHGKKCWEGVFSSRCEWLPGQYQDWLVWQPSRGGTWFGDYRGGKLVGGNFLSWSCVLGLEIMVFWNCRWCQVQGFNLVALQTWTVSDF